MPHFHEGWNASGEYNSDGGTVDAEEKPLDRITEQVGDKTVVVKYGEFEALFMVSVTEVDLEVPPHIYFDYGYRISEEELTAQMNGAAIGTYTMSAGDGNKLVLAPILWGIGENAVFRWYINDVQKFPQIDDKPGCFTLKYGVGGITWTSEGHADNKKLVRVEVTDGGHTYTARTWVECFKIYAPYVRGAHENRPAQNPQARAGKLFALHKAPGQFYLTWPAVGLSPNDAGYLAAAQHWADTDSIVTSGTKFAISLGGWGGYVVFGFDHSVVNRTGGDIHIEGNPLATWHEPGTVWVSQDHNRNGIADDTWYELKGSEYGKPSATQRYSFRWYGRFWTDNRGGIGSLPASSFYGEQGRVVIPGSDFVTYTGTLLEMAKDDVGYYINYGFPSGYVDNRQTQDFDISDAIHPDGSPANLSHIDFVKVQTGMNEYAGIFGEISTETSFPWDKSMGY
jgi:hypothetical protein